MPSLLPTPELQDHSPSIVFGSRKHAVCLLKKQTSLVTQSLQRCPHYEREKLFYVLSVKKMAYLSSDIVTASCLGAGILALFLPSIEQQLPADSFHLWVALVCKLFISLTLFLPLLSLPFALQFATVAKEISVSKE